MTVTSAQPRPLCASRHVKTGLEFCASAPSTLRTILLSCKPMKHIGRELPQVTMAARGLDELLHEFDSHPSLQASLEDFEHEERSPVFGLPSQHSGFRSEDSEADNESNRPWSPPAWRQAASGWYRRSAVLSTSPSRSTGTSPQYESAQEYNYDLTVPANIPLPRSPSKGPTPNATPEHIPQESPVTPMTPMFDDRTDDEPTPTKPRENHNCM